MHAREDTQCTSLDHLKSRGRKSLMHSLSASPPCRLRPYVIPEPEVSQGCEAFRAEGLEGRKGRGGGEGGKRALCVRVTVSSKLRERCGIEACVAMPFVPVVPLFAASGTVELSIIFLLAPAPY